MSAGNVFRQEDPAIMVYSGARHIHVPPLRMEMGWGAPLAEDCWVGLLAWFPTQMRVQNGIYDCLSSLSGLGTIFCSRWDYELASLLWQGSRPGHRDCIAHCFLVRIQAECALNSLLRPPALLCSWGKPWAVLCSSGTALQLSR